MENVIQEDIKSYLSFSLAEEHFAARVIKVLEILEYTKITKIPQAPEFMKGVINLRGQVLPVIDTRIKFDLPPAEITKDTCIIVIETLINQNAINIGIIVDTVEEVLKMEDEQILPPPSIGNKYRSDFISGVAHEDEEFLMILDVDKIMSEEEKMMVKEKLN